MILFDFKIKTKPGDQLATHAAHSESLRDERRGPRPHLQAVHRRGNASPGRRGHQGARLLRQSPTRPRNAAHPGALRARDQACHRHVIHSHIITICDG